MKFFRLHKLGERTKTGPARFFNQKEALALRAAYIRGDTFGQLLKRTNVSSVVLYNVLFKKGAYASDPGPRCRPKKGNGRKFSRMQADLVRIYFRKHGLKATAFHFKAAPFTIRRVVCFLGVYAKDRL